ncbi:sensor histidine kinase [Flavobacterium sp.]|uniref:tetratricopeptide repeat-containing sensor histidine kinase n=1 Tax=Flavobacterium sp. TaxID=239 RepID=UPI00286E97DA|nr:sensor histidine kinase [Flavobacterium sp.]
MKKIILCILVFLNNTTVFSQNERQIDSLLVELNSYQDFVTQINTLNNICLEYNKSNTTKLNIYNQKILALAKKHKYSRGFGFYYLNRSRIYLSKSNGTESLKFSKKAAAFFSKNKDISNYLNSITEMSKDYVQLQDPKKIDSILKNNLNLALSHKDNDIIIDFYRLMGDNFAYQDSIAKSIFYYKKAIPFLSQKKSDSKSIFFQRISDQYTCLNQNDKGLVYIDLSIVNKETNYQFLVEAKKALILNKLSRYNEALNLSLKNYQSILKFKMTSEWQYNLILYNIANAYYNLKKNDLAIPYINKVIDKKNTIQEYKIECFIILSNIYFQKKEKKKARFYSQKALVFHDSFYKQFGNTELYHNVSKIEEDARNYKRALYFYQKMNHHFNKINAQINNENNLLLQTDFDVSLKDYNIKTLQEQKIIKTIENKNQKDLITFIGVLLLIALSGILFYIKTNKTIKNKNKVIENERSRTQKSLLEKETLLKEIHHRVKNNMQMVVSLLKIQSLDAKELSLEDFINVSETRINSMVLVHENLYQSNNLSKVDFKEYLNKLSASILSSYQGLKKIELQIDINQVYFDVQTAIPIGLIINELVNNAYKHAFNDKDKGLISVQLIQNDEKFILTVCDDGLGITDHQINDKGLGLEIVKLLVSQIKGVSQIDNSNGTCFTMRFQNVTL